MNTQPEERSSVEALRHDFDRGKYTVINNHGILTALRYGEPWRDLAGDHLVGAMLHEVRRLHALNAELLEALKWIDRRCPEKYFDAYPGKIHWEAAHDAGACARAAIAKAEEKK